MAAKRKPKTDGSSSPPPAAVAERLEFRHGGDDAWYDVKVAVEEGGEVLRVMYCNFPEDFDERFWADGFRDVRGLEEFGTRLRRGSVQLQDWECGKVAVGMTATVAHSFGKSDVRFYDALIHEVKPTAHPFTEGQCKCAFGVLWQHGPLAGEKIVTSIENICLQQPKHLKVDQAIENFLDLARKKLDERKSNVNPHVGQSPKSSSKIYQGHNLSKSGVATCSGELPGAAVDYRLKKRGIYPCNIGYDPSKVSNSTCSSDPKVGAATCTDGPFDAGVDYQLKKSCSFFNLEDEPCKANRADCFTDPLKAGTAAYNGGSCGGSVDCMLKKRQPSPCDAECGPSNYNDSVVNCSSNPPNSTFATCIDGHIYDAVNNDKLKRHCSSACNFEYSPKVSMATFSGGSHAFASDCWLKVSHVSPYNSEGGRTFKQADCRTPPTFKQADCRTPPQAGKIGWFMTDEDIELGSGSSNKRRADPKETHYFFRIENLEKDLSPFDVMDFIFDYTSIASQVFICPGVSDEVYLRGTLLVETKEEADRLHDFLHNSSHIITSFKGRPWVAHVKWYGSVDGRLPRYERPSRKKCKGYVSKINLVAKGTEEYKRAQALVALHMDFYDRVHNDLVRRLMDNEKKVLQ